MVEAPPYRDRFIYMSSLISEYGGIDLILVDSLKNAGKTDFNVNREIRRLKSSHLAYLRRFFSFDGDFRPDYKIRQEMGFVDGQDELKSSIEDFLGLNQSTGSQSPSGQLDIIIKNPNLSQNNILAESYPEWIYTGQPVPVRIAFDVQQRLQGLPIISGIHFMDYDVGPEKCSDLMTRYILASESGPGHFHETIKQYAELMMVHEKTAYWVAVVTQHDLICLEDLPQIQLAVMKASKEYRELKPKKI